jgi:hypothetical protein
MNNKLILKIGFGLTLLFLSNGTNSNYYDMYSSQQFIEYFFPQTFNYNLLLNESNESNEKNKVLDIKIWNIQETNENIMNLNELNMLICVENCDRWTWYKHYNTYKNYGNKKMNIYLYNHISSIEKTDNYIAIPLIHFRINYYLLNKDIVKPTETTNFNDKKFCLMVNRSGLNNEINIITNIMGTMGQVDNISLHTDALISKSCYNSVELLNVFNKYKFVICFENSYADGYITEKIFNCFFAKTIPIYKGSPIVEKYFNISTFIDVRNLNKNNIDLIKELNSNETLYNQYISTEKISTIYDNENYQKEFTEFIEKKRKT